MAKKNRCRCVAPIALAICILGIASCGEPSSEERLNRAQTYRESGNAAGSALELKEVLRKDPSHAGARWMLGEVYLLVRDGASAEKELRRALDLGATPEFPQLALSRAWLLQGKFNQIVNAQLDETISGKTFQDVPRSMQAELAAIRGHSYLGLDDSDNAQRQYELAMELDPECAEGLFGHARMMGVRGDPAGVRQWLDRLFAVRQDFAPAWSLLGDLEMHEGNVAAAENAYGKSLDFDGRNEYTLLARATARITLSNLSGAEADLKKAERFDKNSAAVAYVRGLIAYETGRLGDAEASFLQALVSNKNHLPALFYAGLVQIRLNKLQQARTHLEQYFSLVPTSIDAGHLLASLSAGEGDYDRADEILHDVLSRHPNDVGTLELLGRLALQVGDREQAIQLFQESLAQDISDKGAYERIGLALFKAGDASTGIKTMEKARAPGDTNLEFEIRMVASLLRAGNPDEALRIAIGSIKTFPQAAVLHFLLGLSYEQTAQFDEALATYAHVLELDPGQVDAKLGMARIAMHRRDTDRASSLYEEILKADSNNLAALLGYGELEISIGNLERAVGLLKTALAANPQAIQPRILLARFFTRTGNPAEAETILEAGLQYHSNNLFFMTELAEAQLARGKSEVAMQTVNKLEKSYPDDPGTHFLKAKISGSRGDALLSIQSLDRTLELDPTHRLANIAKARMLLKERKYEAAKDRLSKIVERFPDDPLVLSVEAEIALAQGDSGRALAAARRAHEKDRTSSSLISLSSLQWAINQRDAAKETLTNWIKDHPADVRVRIALADLYLVSGQESEAVSEFEASLKHDPDNGLVLNNLAWQLRDRDPRRALGLAEQAVKSAPNQAQFLDTLGVLQMRDDPKGSVETLRKAVALPPDNPTTWLHLAEAQYRAGLTSDARIILDELLSGAPFAERDRAVLLRQQIP